MTKKAITKKQAAIFLGVCERTVNRWMRNNDLPYHRASRNHLRFYEEELVEWMKKRTKMIEDSYKMRGSDTNHEKG